MSKNKEVIELLEKQIQHEFGLFDTEEAKQRLSKDWVNGYKRGVDWLFMRVKRMLSQPIGEVGAELIKRENRICHLHNNNTVLQASLKAQALPGQKGEDE